MGMGNKDIEIHIRAIVISLEREPEVVLTAGQAGIVRMRGVESVSGVPSFILPGPNPSSRFDKTGRVESYDIKR